MLETGAIDEVQALLSRQLLADLPAMKAIGVPELSAMLAGELDRTDAVEKAKTASRRYAKRQITWIRGQMPDWPAYEEADELVRQCLDLFAQPA